MELTVSRIVGLGECVVSNVLNDVVISPLTVDNVADQLLSVGLTDGLRLTARDRQTFTLHARQTRVMLQSINLY